MMRTGKRIAVLALVLLMLSLCACKEQKGTNAAESPVLTAAASTPEPTPEATPEPTPAPTPIPQTADTGAGETTISGDEVLDD